MLRSLRLFAGNSSSMGSGGAVNYFVQFFGGTRQAWLADPRFALYAVAVADIWLYIPFVFLVLYTSLQVIPNEPLEAARIDGATGWQIFMRIIFPLLIPSFLLILIIRLVDTFRVFDLVYVMTNGGPGGRTATLGFLSYEWIFRHFNMGRGSVIAIFILGAVILISWYFIKVLQLQFLEQVK
ncbi:MAG: sugar ABC transporter permease [Atribacterota bacterium]